MSADITVHLTNLSKFLQRVSNLRHFSRPSRGPSASGASPVTWGLGNVTSTNRKWTETDNFIRQHVWVSRVKADRWLHQGCGWTLGPQIRVRRRWRGTSVRFHLLFIRICLNEAVSIDSLQMPSSAQIILLLLCVEMVADLLFSFPNLDIYCLLLSLLTRHFKKNKPKKPRKKSDTYPNPNPHYQKCLWFYFNRLFSLHTTFSVFFFFFKKKKLMSCVLFTFSNIV